MMEGGLRMTLTIEIVDHFYDLVIFGFYFL